MNKRILLALAIMVAFALSVFGPIAIAAVTPAPEHPGTHNTVAKTPAEHKAAAEHHKKMAAYHKGMAKHHESMAMEHKKLGHAKLAKHHKMLAKHHTALAKEHSATAKTHMMNMKSKAKPAAKEKTY